MRLSDRLSMYVHESSLEIAVYYMKLKINLCLSAGPADSFADSPSRLKVMKLTNGNDFGFPPLIAL
jgi:hypothetical protein